LQQHEQVRLAAARTRLERIARDLGPAPNADCQIVIGDPAEQIPAIATDSKIGLIVLTLRSAAGVPQGTTTYRVLGSVTIPVLALPKDWGRASS
jgi:hypothetical protein